MTRKKKPKPVDEMTNDELIRSVFPDVVVDKVREELHLDERDEEEEKKEDRDKKRFT